MLNLYSKLMTDMRKSLRYYISLLLLPFFLFTVSVTVSSCDPHRSGSVIKGPSAKTNRHHRPASSKRRRKNKY